MDIGCIIEVLGLSQVCAVNNSSVVSQTTHDTGPDQAIQLRALYHLSVELSALRSLESVLKTALKHCLDLTGSQFGCIGLTMADETAMDVVEVQGFHAAEEFYEHFRLIPLRPNPHLYRNGLHRKRTEPYSPLDCGC